MKAYDEKGNITAYRVRLLRENRGWSQKDLAEKVFVTNSQISRLEIGQTTNIGSPLLVALAKVFCVSTDYLVGLTPVSTPKSYDSFQSGYSAGVLMEVDETIASEMKQTLQDVAVQSVTRDGKMYGIPIAVETMVMFYNKDLVEEPAQSFEQIVEEAKQWNVPEENKFRFLCQLTGYSAHAFMTAFGFELFGADGLSENPGVDSQAFLDGLTYLSTLKQTMPIDSANLSMTSGSFLDQNFYDGKTAYYINGPWFVDMLADKDINYGVAKMPTINGQPMKPFGGVQNAHVSVYTKYPKAAQCFAQFLASEECAQMLYEEASKITARKDYASIPGLCDDADLMIIAEQFTESVPMPGSERLSYFWTLTNSVYSSVFDGTLTPEQGAEKAQADFDALVKSE